MKGVHMGGQHHCVGPILASVPGGGTPGGGDCQKPLPSQLMWRGGRQTPLSRAKDKS